jgi:hypothetical protein
MPRVGQGAPGPALTPNPVAVGNATATGRDGSRYGARVMVIRAAGSGQP